MEFPFLGFSKIFVGCRKTMKVIEGFGAFDRRITFSDWDAGILGVGYNTWGLGAAPLRGSKS